MHLARQTEGWMPGAAVNAPHAHVQSTSINQSTNYYNYVTSFCLYKNNSIKPCTDDAWRWSTLPKPHTHWLNANVP